MYSDKEWDDIYSGGCLASYPNIKIVSFMFRAFGKDRAAAKGIKALDLGCGGGNNTWFLAREGFDTYAVDGSEKAVALTKERLEKEGTVPARCVHGNFTRLPYDENFFDAVVDDFCVQANVMKDVKTIFGQVFRVLKPAGKYFGLLLSSANQEMMQGEEIEPGTFRGTRGERNARQRTVHFFSREELEELLSRAGFSAFEINSQIVTYANQTRQYQSWIVEAQK